MDIEFKASAFRHKISEADIHHAFMNPYHESPIEDIGKKNNRFIRLGFDRSGNLLELLYNDYDDHVCIFHAMRCRNIYFSLLEVQEKIMESMTEEEAFILDEYYTRNPPKVDPSKARIRIPMVRIDEVTAEYLAKEAKLSNKKPEEILSGLVREKMAMHTD